MALKTQVRKALRKYLSDLKFLPKRSMIEGSLRRYYPDGDIDAKIRNDVHFFSNFNFVRAMVRTESRRFADVAEEGYVLPC